LRLVNGFGRKAMNNYLPFEVIAAVRFLREGLVQSLLIIVGAAVGVSVIVFMSALLAGVQANILGRVLSTQAQIVVQPRKDASRPVLVDNEVKVIRVMQSRSQRQVTVDQWRKLRSSFAKMAAVEVVSPVASGSVFVVKGSSTRTVTLTGIEPENYYRFITIPDYVVSGTSRITSQDLLIGKDLAEDIGIKVSDKILLRTSSGSSDTLNVAGIFDLGNKIFNERTVVSTLNTAQNLLGMVGNVSSIDLTLKNPNEADTIADTIAAVHPVKADSWIRTNAQFFTAMRTQNISFGAIRTSVGLSVALGIASVLVVSVVQRSREIGILRAMGASQAQIMRVFLVQGGIVGLVGSIVGSLLSRGFLALWLTFAVNPDGSPFFTIKILPSLYLLTALLATICGVLAAAVPALRASRLNPVEAIRG
jgi:lipoprotein-releasing system permease protein